MKKNINKLTAATLKRIIAEEKYKLVREGKIGKSSSNESSVLSEFLMLLKIKKSQRKKALELKKLHEAKKALKAKLLNRI